MFCSKCGQENDNSARFCIQCREPFKSTNTISSHKTFSPADLRDGKLLDNGRYRIIGNRPCGSGGMGEVWRAEDTELQMTVAIKVLPGILAINKASIENLKREASIALRLTHPGICRLYNFCSDADVKFLVMEYIEGQTLEEYIDAKQEGRLSIDELLPIARQIADALDYAHNAVYMDASGRKVRGVLHRDIKPSNIMLNPEGLLKVLDFGIAREVHETMARVTAPKSTSQTPDYASPEQFRGDPTTAASDIYSFTAVIYECLAGRPLIQARGNLEYQILKREFEPLPAQTEVVNSALKSGLAKDPDERPPTASALVDLLVAAPDTPQIKSLRRQASQAQADKDFETERDLLAEIRRVAPYDRQIRDRLAQIELDIVVRDTQRSLTQARKDMQSGDLDAAAQRYKEAIELSPENVEAAEGVHDVEAKLSEIVGLLEQARESSAGFRHDETLQHASRILRIKPDHLDAPKMKSDAEHILKRMDELSETAATARENSDYELEKKLLEELQTLAPEDDATIERLGQIEGDIIERETRKVLEAGRTSVGESDFEAAGTHYRNALEMDPENEEASAELGQVEAQLARLNELLARATASAQSKDHQRTLELAAEALRIKPDHPKGAELRTGAEQALERLDQLDQEAIRLHNEKAYDAERNLLQEALELALDDGSLRARLDNAVELTRRRDAENARERGRAALEKGNYRWARAELQRASQLSPHDTGLLEALAQIEAALPQLARAIEEARPLVEEAQQAYNEKQYSRAQQQAEKALAVSDRFALADAWTGSEHDNEPVEELRSVRAAAETVCRAAEEKRRLVGRLQQNAEADERNKHYYSALSCLTRLLQLEPDIAAINERITKLRSLAQAQRVRQARIIAASAILFVGLVIIWSIVNVARGRNAAEEVDVAFKQKRYDAVQQRYNKVAGICRLPLVPDGFVGLKAAAKLRDGASDYLRQIESSLLKADGHFRNEEYRLARGAYVEALNIQPDHGYAQERVEVIDNLEQIIASNIESARKFHSQKEYLEAKSHIEKVLGLQRSNQEATELLGKCDEELGEYDGKMRQANAAAKERDLDAAIRLYGEALRLYASKEAQKGLSDMEKLLEEYAGKLQPAKQALKNKQYDEALNLAGEALTLYPSRQEPQRIEREAGAAIQKINNLWAACQQFMEQRFLQSAHAALTQLLELQPGHKTAPGLKEKVEIAIRDSEQLLDKTRKLLDKGEPPPDRSDYEQARKDMLEAISLDAENPEAPELLRKVTRHLPPERMVALFVERFPLGMDMTMRERFRKLFPGLDEKLYEDELSIEQTQLKDFLIGMYEVTNEEFCLFLNTPAAAKITFPDHPAIKLQGKRYVVEPGLEHLPVTNVSWHQASDYCEWYSTRIGFSCHLPTEAQWEAAASWDAKPGRKRIFPWGDQLEIDDDFIKTDKPRRVGGAGLDVSPSGVFDMGGNVAEWCLNQHTRGKEAKVFKGGSWRDSALHSWRTTARNPLHPEAKRDYVGFRVAAEMFEQ